MYLHIQLGIEKNDVVTDPHCTSTLGVNLIQIPLHLLKGKVASFSVRSLPY